MVMYHGIVPPLKTMQKMADHLNTFTPENSLRVLLSG